MHPALEKLLASGTVVADGAWGTQLQSPGLSGGNCPPTSKPVWIEANAGLPEIVEGQLVYQSTPEQFSEFAPALIAGGANFIGGCCGASPEFIRALRQRVAGCA